MRIEHVGLWTRDVERLAAFYAGAFDAEVGELYENPRTGFSSRFLRLGDGARLELMAMASIPESMDDTYAQATGYVHIAVSLGSEAAVDELTARLAEEGVEVLDGPRRTGDGYYEAVVLDPDGNRVELTV